MTTVVFALLLHMTPTVAARDTVTLCVADAVTQAPLIGANVTRSIVGDTAPHTRRWTSACAFVIADSVLVQRTGYRPQHLVLRTSLSARPAHSDTVTVRLVPLDALLTNDANAAVLAAVRVEASAAERDQHSASTGHLTASVTADAARRTGANTVAQLVERLPFTTMLSARGESGLSLRGARREQVSVTLNGLALNDPATGAADLADIPLVALGSASVTLGANPLVSGAAAVGGVMALTTASRRSVSVRTGSFGAWGGEGAWSTVVSGAVVHGAAHRTTARNDFAFDNDAGATDVVGRERRVNNDETRSAVDVGVIASRWQLLTLLSRAERGMVGPVNVRTNDSDRARTDRMLVRGQATVGKAQLSAGLRRFALAYRDPFRAALNADATSHAVDVDLRGAQTRTETNASGAARMALVPNVLAWRVGAGHDVLRASSGIAQSRSRVFATALGSWQSGTAHTEIGARLDVVPTNAGQPTLVHPSVTVAVSRPMGSVLSLSARASQALRVPTLYDLYFSSPQRVSVVALKPERVRADLELAAHAKGRVAWGAWQTDVALVARDTRDAIVWFPGNFGWSPANVGRETLRGIDGRALIASSWGEWSAWTSYYLTDLEIGTLHIPTPYVPRVSGGAQWSLAQRATTGTVRARVMGRRPFSAGPASRAYELPAVTLMDLTVARVLTTRLLPDAWSSTAVLTLENALNVEWQSIRGFPAPGRRWALSFTLQLPTTP